MLLIPFFVVVSASREGILKSHSLPFSHTIYLAKKEAYKWWTLIETQKSYGHQAAH
jgi:hypothetical protein